MKNYVIKRTDGFFAGDICDPTKTWVGINDAYILTESNLYDLGLNNSNIKKGERLVEVEIFRAVREVKG